MIRFQIQSTYFPDYEHTWINGTQYMIRNEEVGAKPLPSFEEARRTVRRQMARDRKYGRTAKRYRIVEITYRVREEFKQWTDMGSRAS